MTTPKNLAPVDSTTTGPLLLTDAVAGAIAVFVAPALLYGGNRMYPSFFSRQSVTQQGLFLTFGVVFVYRIVVGMFGGLLDKQHYARTTMYANLGGLVVMGLLVYAFVTQKINSDAAIYTAGMVVAMLAANQLHEISTA